MAFRGLICSITDLDCIILLGVAVAEIVNRKLEIEKLQKGLSFKTGAF